MAWSEDIVGINYIPTSVEIIPRNNSFTYRKGSYSARRYVLYFAQSVDFFLQNSKVLPKHFWIRLVSFDIASYVAIELPVIYAEQATKFVFTFESTHWTFRIKKIWRFLSGCLVCTIVRYM